MGWLKGLVEAPPERELLKEGWPNNSIEGLVEASP